MSDDVEADFARLHGVAQIGHAGFNAAGQHPLFSAVHSFTLAHKYGKEDPRTYMRNPGLRQMDTREAAMQGMQKLGEGVRRWSDYYKPSVPGPVPPIPGVNTTVPPTNPGSYQYKPGNYSQAMTPPGTPIGKTMP